MTRRYAFWGTLIPVLLLTIILGLSLRPRSPSAAGTVRGDMGIVVTDLTPEACHAAGVKNGVLVIDVLPGGPADRKGIQEGDIITEYENDRVVSVLQLISRIRHDGPGFMAGVSIWRDGSESWLGFVQLAAEPAPPPSGDVILERFERLENDLGDLRARADRIEQLEDDLADLRARVDSLERTRPIPRRPVVLHSDPR